MAREKFIHMIIVFTIYLIFLIWLFEFIEINDSYNLKKDSYKDITIIIDKINNIKDLFLTIDSIKSQDYNLNSINLILLDTSTEDVQSLINSYKHIFLSINVIKVSHMDRIDMFNSIESLSHDYILFLESGVYISKSFINTITKYLDESDLSMIFLPLFYKYQSKYRTFYQIYNSFIQSIQCSLINKNFNLQINKNVAIKKESFGDLINTDFSNISTQYLVAPDLCLYKNEDNYPGINSNVNTINIVYSIINFFFIFALIQFLASPNKYFLAIIIIKIIPELSFIYTFYNRLQIKFPKFDYLIFSMVGPFYSLIEIIYNKVLIKNNQS